jgi:dTDP-4-dehydrorhamnose reductase
MNCLIVGANGQLGLSLQEVLKTKKIEFLPLSRKELDVTDFLRVMEVCAKSRVDLIINAAAYTNVEQAEIEMAKAFLINESGARNLAIAARENNAKLIHFSTDYVFSGSRKSPWKVDSEVNPLSIYGKSKLAGEKAIMHEYADNSIVIRTSWLYSPFGKNFYKTILNLALSSNNPINVVIDQIGQPTNATDLANLAITAAEDKVPAGFYHGSNSGFTSWHDFAIEIFKLAGADTDRVRAITSKDLRNKAPRPEYSVLDNSKWLDFGVKPLDPWQESVSRAFQAIHETFS